MILDRIIYFVRRSLSHSYAKMRFGHIGKGSYIFNPIRLIGRKNIYIGNHTYILDNGRIEAIDYFQEKNFSPQIVIGNDVNIEQNVHITCANRIVIGDGCSILPNVLITDITHPYDDINMAPKYQSIEVHAVEIGKDCMIGMGARIMPGVKIGEHCVIGANAVVTDNVRSYNVVAGIPAKVIKAYDKMNHCWKSS